jgi:predicted AlkP superfamily phosphohydrolase/phosphomutase
MLLIRLRTANKGRSSEGDGCRVTIATPFFWKGREARGTVEPGAAYDELCAKIEAGLKSFHDIETGAPVVARIERADKVCEGFDIRHSRIPDLVVSWHPIRAYETRGVTSAEHGDVVWESAWPIPSGRCGDHSPRGWLAASGPGIPSLHSHAVNDIAALAPTILQWFTASPSHTPATVGIEALQV